jgi:flagellar protein FliS
MAVHQSHYLESKVLTAPPHRLHLMLIEGALRFGRQAEEAMGRGDHAGAAGPLLRVIDIVGELLAGVRKQKGGPQCGELNGKVAELYWFLFRRVSEAKIRADAGALAEALRLLEYERQTWQLVCEKLSAGGEGNAPHQPISAPHLSKSGLSLEA